MLWVGTRNGIARADLARGDLTHVAPSPSGLASPMVFAVLQDRRGAIWVGTDDGLFRHDRRAGTFAPLRRAAGFADRPRRGWRPRAARGRRRDALDRHHRRRSQSPRPATGAVPLQRRTPRTQRPQTELPRPGAPARPAGTVWAGEESGCTASTAVPRRRDASPGSTRTERNRETRCGRSPGRGGRAVGRDQPGCSLRTRTGATHGTDFRHGPVVDPGGDDPRLHLDARGALWLGMMGEASPVRPSDGPHDTDLHRGHDGLPDKTVYAVQPARRVSCGSAPTLGSPAQRRIKPVRDVRAVTRGAVDRVQRGRLVPKPQGQPPGYTTATPRSSKAESERTSCGLEQLRSTVLCVTNERVGPSARTGHGARRSASRARSSSRTTTVFARPNCRPLMPAAALLVPPTCNRLHGPQHPLAAGRPQATGELHLDLSTLGPICPVSAAAARPASWQP